MFSVLERYLDLEELNKNLNIQKNREGTWVSFKSMGESFLPIPESIFTISAIEFQGAARILIIWSLGGDVQVVGPTTYYPTTAW